MRATEDDCQANRLEKSEVRDNPAHNAKEAEHYCATWRWVSPHQEPKSCCVGSGDSFSKHYWGPVNAPNPEITDELVQKTQAKAQFMSSELFASWTRLHVVFGRHEEMIKKRWSKKNRTQRRKLLVNA
jgi:hypothetical protein